SPDGKTLATGSDDPIVKLWDLATGKVLREFDTEDRGLDARPVAFSPDGKLLASGCSNGRVIVWSLDTGNVAYGIAKASGRSVSSLVFTRDGKELISAGVRFERTGKQTGQMVSEIRAWDAATGSANPGFGTPPNVDGDVTLALSADGRKLYSAH